MIIYDYIDYIYIYPYIYIYTYQDILKGWRYVFERWCFALRGALAEPPAM